MRYGLLSTAAVAALALSVAAGIAQTSGSGSGAGGSSGGSGAAASPSGGAGGSVERRRHERRRRELSVGIGRRRHVEPERRSRLVRRRRTADGWRAGNGLGLAAEHAVRDKRHVRLPDRPGRRLRPVRIGPGRRLGTHSGTTTGSVPANITSEQRTQITRSFSNVHVAPATNVNFAISTGTIVPASVEWHDLPVEVVRVVPAYRGYKYILVGNRIVIIEPGTRKIVTVIERTA